MNIANLEDELEKWEAVRYRMKEEGMEYCFRNYSNFEEIEDPHFHMLRILLLDYMKQIESHVNDMIDELNAEINNHE